MQARVWVLLLLVGAVSSKSEIVDRIAVTIDKTVIAESEIVAQIRVTAFLNEAPVDLGRDARRTAADRLVEQALIRREIEISLYPTPSATEVEQQLEKMKATHFPDPQLYRAKLDEYGITEEDLRQSVVAQLLILHFIDYRFRPGITVTDSEVRQYYQEEFLPAFAQKSSGPPPGLEDSRDKIEEILIGRRIDETLDNWLERTKKQAVIRYRDEAFQ